MKRSKSVTVPVVQHFRISRVLHIGSCCMGDGCQTSLFPRNFLSSWLGLMTKFDFPKSHKQPQCLSLVLFAVLYAKWCTLCCVALKDHLAWSYSLSLSSLLPFPKTVGHFGSFAQTWSTNLERLSTERLLVPLDW